MENIQCVISAEAIARLTDRLYDELHPERSRILRQTLLEAENRYGERAERLDLIAQHIKEISDRIKRQYNTIKALEARAQDSKLARQVLNNFIDIRQEFNPT